MGNESWKTYSNALRKLLERPALLEKFQEDVDGSGTADLNLSSDMRVDLKNFFLALPTRLDDSGSAEIAGEEEFRQSVVSAEAFFEETYRHIRRGALVTTVMSVAIFIMGLCLLGVAAVQSLVREEPGTAIALAASGIVAIAAAFYRSPVTQMRQSAADVQRSRMVLLSYVLGLGLIGKSLSGQQIADENSVLAQLTRDLVALLPGERLGHKNGEGT